jgi:hypothetical protein
METKNLSFYLFAFILVVIASYAGNKWNAFLENPDKDNELIREYLLNESPLYGYNRPKMWIHSKYEVNARKWRDFQSRNTTDLNQPYLYLVIKTIIDHCGADFNICLIDDESFSKLIPYWDVDVANLAEPFRSHIREIGMTQLLYIYGGMVVPNSFVCSKNLIELYHQGTEGNRPFVCENINRTSNLAKHTERLSYLPDIRMMGALKNDPTIREFLTYLKMRNQSIHFTDEYEFLGESSAWVLKAAKQGKINIVGAELVGVKSKNKRMIQMEDLLEEADLYLSPTAYGIWIPRDEILRRPKFEWFAVLTYSDVLKTNTFLTKYLISCSLPMNNDMYHKSKEIRSVISI